ncbi:MAG: DUF4097 family beta strand repeat-containing protein [Candidatus Acidiferrales bacterium]
MKLHKLTFAFVLVALLGIGAIATLPASARVVAEGTFERTLAVTGPVDLGVKTGSGSISVRAGEAGRVRVVGTIKVHSNWGISRGDAEEKVRRLKSDPPIEQTGNTIRIGKIEDRDLRQNVSISYEIIVPRETQLSTHSGSGGQTIEGLKGPVQAETGSGSIKVSDIGGEVNAETGSGSIDASDIGGRLVAGTGSGSIRATGIAGAARASTGSGSVRLELVTPGEVEVETGSGSVEVTGLRGALRVDTGSGSITVDGTPTGNWKLSTGSGGISLTFPEGAAFELNASTSSGRIYSGHPILVQGEIGKRELRGKVRGGGVLVAVSTGSGNIRIY